VGRFDIKWGRF